MLATLTAGARRAVLARARGSDLVGLAVGLRRHSLLGVLSLRRHLPKGDIQPKKDDDEGKAG